MIERLFSADSVTVCKISLTRVVNEALINPGKGTRDNFTGSKNIGHAEARLISLNEGISYMNIFSGIQAKTIAAMAIFPGFFLQSFRFLGEKYYYYFLLDLSIICVLSIHNTLM